jgi:hypothetical protein
LLLSDQAARLWQIASVGSQSHRIARAIGWLKQIASTKAAIGIRTSISDAASNAFLVQLQKFAYRQLR